MHDVSLIAYFSVAMLALNCDCEGARSLQLSELDCNSSTFYPSKTKDEHKKNFFYRIYTTLAYEKMARFTYHDDSDCSDEEDFIECSVSKRDEHIPLLQATYF